MALLRALENLNGKRRLTVYSTSILVPWISFKILQKFWAFYWRLQAAHEAGIPDKKKFDIQRPLKEIIMYLILGSTENSVFHWHNLALIKRITSYQEFKTLPENKKKEKEKKEFKSGIEPTPPPFFHFCSNTLHNTPHDWAASGGQICLWYAHSE
jgi:hypothetical protein